jgi:hypothetical protein
MCQEIVSKPLFQKTILYQESLEKDTGVLTRKLKMKVTCFNMYINIDSALPNDIRTFGVSIF